MKKTSYYFGLGVALGSLFGGLLSIILSKHTLVAYVGGIVLGGLIGLIYGKIKNKK